MSMIPKVPEYNLLSVNRCLDVEHPVDSIDQKVNDVNLCQERDNMSLRHTDLKVLNIVSKTISRMMS